MVNISEGEKYKIFWCFTQGIQNFKKPRIKIGMYWKNDTLLGKFFYRY